MNTAQQSGSLPNAIEREARKQFGTGFAAGAISALLLLVGLGLAIWPFWAHCLYH